MEYLSELELSQLGKAAITFILSLSPIIELRGAIPAGVLMGLPVLTSAAIGTLGNMLPIPFIILFTRRILAGMRRRSRRLERIAAFIEAKAHARGDVIFKGAVLGLIIFVAIPLPGTGAWTGALIASVFNIRIKIALPAITAGVVIAGVLTTGITYGFKSLF
jgi:uncharacterized membrane protein